jgi:Trk K+ transport system NAD-binding subunit
MSGGLEALSGHVVICNCNEKIPEIVRELRTAEHDLALDVVLLIQDEALWKAHPAWHPPAHPRFHTVVGLPTEPADLKRAGISRARAAVILADPSKGQLADASSSLVAVAIERANPQVHTIMQLILSTNRPHLRHTEVNEVVCLNDIAEKLLAQSCITPGLSRLFTYLLTTDVNTCQIFVCELGDQWAGRTYRELCRRSVERGFPFTLLGYILGKWESGKLKVIDQAEPVGPAHPGKTVFLNPRSNEKPGKDYRLGAHDHLIVLAYERPNLNQFALE